jgi:hypothetical protein
MKVFVLCDAHGNVESVAVPDPAAAGHAVMAATGDGRVYELDVNPRTFSPDDLINPRSEAARTRTYKALRRAISARRT